MEGGAPPEGGLVSAVNETLLSEPGGPGTKLNTLNTTLGNTTHGTSHKSAPLRSLKDRRSASGTRIHRGPATRAVRH
eukprot:5331885-Prymnesium_polylepis.1